MVTVRKCVCNVQMRPYLTSIATITVIKFGCTIMIGTTVYSTELLKITPHVHARAGTYVIGDGIHIYVCGQKKV